MSKSLFLTSALHIDMNGILEICLNLVLAQEKHVRYKKVSLKTLTFNHISASVFEQKHLAGRGNVKVSLGEDQLSKWSETITCETGKVAYRKGHLMSLLMIFQCLIQMRAQ